MIDYLMIYVEKDVLDNMGNKLTIQRFQNIYRTVLWEIVERLNNFDYNLFFGVKKDVF
jgi:hypothetical protein